MFARLRPESSERTAGFTPLPKNTKKIINLRRKKEKREKRPKKNKPVRKISKTRRPRKGGLKNSRARDEVNPPRRGQATEGFSSEEKRGERPKKIKPVRENFGRGERP
ncbi:MAG: hypothetical protein LBR53_10605 [Deltaproteobacteria bacterium]|nr:hypothetical protein [Deltaproteobacteria bacterium]